MTDTPAPLRWNDVLRIAREGNPAPPRRVEKPPQEWRAILDPQTFQVAREKGTERPHSSPMCDLFEPGQYACVCCNTLLFDSAQKFQSGTGWPSFTQAVAPDVIAFHEDLSYGRVRIEVTCNVCDCHLGHVFPDGPPPSGLRYCINAVSLTRIKAR
ncbi:MAG TPA: peptide-methionine (R)-S-oxide reductase MsrB [Steroidobacteraceae bacterium]|nr:peptide-methionine (R)-S-oxide reductase MsrB [Steroidobacteraceae bacterium]